jgi:hypothetical protein
LESRHGRYGAGKKELRIKKIWTMLILCKPSLLLSQGGSHARQGGALPKAPQGHKYNCLGAPRWLPIDIHSSESCRRSPQEEDAEALPQRCRSWRTARIDLHRMHLPHSTIPCLASWWSRFVVCPWSCNGSWYVVTKSCLYRNLLFLCWWCLVLKVWPPCFSGRSCGLCPHTVIINRFSKDYLHVVTVRGGGKC